MADFVTVSHQGPVATVILNRPELHNAFNEQFIEELDSTFCALSNNNQVRVVVLRAEGRSFCAGADLNWMKKMIDYNFDQNVEDARGLAKMLKSIRMCAKPTIARVQGAAYGGGVGLIAACDMAVAIETTTFGLTEVKLGILPAVISPFVLEKIGNAHASRYFLTAETFDAFEAKRIGLLSEVCGSDMAMDDKIQVLIRHILKNGPEAVNACKTLIYKVANAMWEPAESVTCQMIAERRVSPEGQEGIRSFLEKRTPAWVSNTEQTADAR